MKYLRLFIVSCLLASVVQAQTLRWSDSSRLGRPFAKDPSVIRFHDHYFLYFSLPAFDPQLAPTNAPAGWSIGIAESTNLLDWTKVGELWPEQPCESKGICAPGARVLNGRVHLFYQTYGNGPKDAICHADSADGIHFTRDPSNPVFHATGFWNNGRAIDAEVFANRGYLLLFFATRDPQGQKQLLGLAGAPLGSDFSRSNWVQLCDHAILRPELPWEQSCIEAPTVTRRGDELVLFYAGAFNNSPQQIGVAHGKDGVHWERFSREPFLANGAPGTWNSSESGHPGYFQDDDGRSYLFYQGNPDHGHTWSLSFVPLTWDGNRPVLAKP
jgi:predicted GH43/DUF377 family glycosyl hydrolase